MYISLMYMREMGIRESHPSRERDMFKVLQCVAVCCSVLQCVAVCCSVLQCKQCLSNAHRSDAYYRDMSHVHLSDVERDLSYRERSLI